MCFPQHITNILRLCSGLIFIPRLSTVDSLLDPDNRLHLTTEEQLKALLDKMDIVALMPTSGGRTKRVRLLRREINTLRQRMNQEQQSAQSMNGNNRDEEEEEEEEEVEEQPKKGKKKKEDAENGPLTAVSNSTIGTILYYPYNLKKKFIIKTEILFIECSFVMSSFSFNCQIPWSFMFQVVYCISAL